MLEAVIFIWKKNTTLWRVGGASSSLCTEIWWMKSCLSQSFCEILEDPSYSLPTFLFYGVKTWTCKRNVFSKSIGNKTNLQFTLKTFKIMFSSISVTDFLRFSKQKAYSLFLIWKWEDIISVTHFPFIPSTLRSSRSLLSVLNSDSGTLDLETNKQ